MTKKLDWPIIITVPGDIFLLSRNAASRNWKAEYGKGQNAKALGRQAWIGAGRPRSPVRVRVDLRIFRTRRIDQFNVWGAVKHVVDGIFVDGLTPDDGEKWVVTGRITQVTGKRWRGRERVEFVCRDDRDPWQGFQGGE